MEGFISFLAPRRPDRAGPSLGYLLLAAIALFSSGSGATVYTGVDTLVVDEGFDFSERRRTTNPNLADFDLGQVWELDVAVAGPGALNAIWGLRDLGAVPFDSLISVPDTLGPDPEGAVWNPQTGAIGHWGARLVEGHLYLVWTQEGHLAKVLIEKVISAPEKYGEELAPSRLWREFIACVVFRWAYQDDGSRSFETETAVPATSWGRLKHLHKENF